MRISDIVSLLSYPVKVVLSYTHPNSFVNSYVHYMPQITTLRKESSQTNAILQYKLLAAILSADCCIIQQS